MTTLRFTSRAEAIANICPPGPGFAKLHPQPYDTLPEGFHTTGPWISPAGEVWKALIGGGCTIRNGNESWDFCPTDEAEALEALADLPSFPRNWRVEDSLTPRGPLRWLVRPRCEVVEFGDPRRLLEMEDVLQIERDVREANRQGWIIDDTLRVAFDPADQLFIIDLSTARHHEPRIACRSIHSDLFRIDRFMRHHGYEQLAGLRENAQNVLSPFSGRWRADEINTRIRLYRERQHLVHVYASTARPIDGLWADIPGAVYEPGHPGEDVYTWVLTSEALDKAQTDRYELIWAWSPLLSLQKTGL